MAELITIPGIKGVFVAGLSWRHEDDVPRARELAALSRFNGRWGAVRRTLSNAVQAGFCDPIEGVKPAQVRVLAAAIAEQRPQPWLGLFQLAEDRYWLIAVRNGHEIIPNGDVVGSLNDVLRVREQHLALGDWTPFDGDLPALAEMISASARTLVLRDLQRNPWTSAAWITAGVAGVALAAGGVLVWHHRQVEEQARLERQRREAIEAALEARRDAEANVLPWTREPLPSQVADACGRAWSGQSLSSGSWSLGVWRCSTTHDGIVVAADWTGGRAQDAPGLLSADAKASHTAAHHAVPFTMGSSHALLDADARRPLWTFAQTYGFGLAIQGDSGKAALPGSSPDKPVQSAWTRNLVQLTFDMPPWMGWARDLDALPGVRVQDITWSGAPTHTVSAQGGSGTLRWQATLELYTLNQQATPSMASNHKDARNLHQHVKKAAG